MTRQNFNPNSPIANVNGAPAMITPDFLRWLQPGPQAITVAQLPDATERGVGAREFVTDASSPTFGAAVTGGGSTATPVYSDGADWRVG